MLTAGAEESFHCQRVHQKDQQYRYVDSWSLPNNSKIHATHFQNNQNNTLRCITLSIYAWDEVVLTQQPKAVICKTKHYLHELRKQIKIHKLCRDDPQEAQLFHIDLYTSGKGPYKGNSENQEMRKVGLSETHAPRNREDSTHNDWWKANWCKTSTGEKDQDGHRTTKSEKFQGVGSVHTHWTQTTNWIFFVKIVIEWWMLISFSPEFSWQFLRVRTQEKRLQCVRREGCTYTIHSLIARTFFCTVTFAHFSCVSHTRMAQGCQKSFLHMCHISPSRFLQSHVSPILAVPWRSRRDHSWLWRPHVLASLTCPKSAGHAHFHTSSEKFGYLATSVLNTVLGDLLFSGLWTSLRVL